MTKPSYLGGFFYLDVYGPDVIWNLWAVDHVSSRLALCSEKDEYGSSSSGQGKI